MFKIDPAGFRELFLNILPDGFQSPQKQSFYVKFIRNDLRFWEGSSHDTAEQWRQIHNNILYFHPLFYWDLIEIRI